MRDKMGEDGAMTPADRTVAWVEADMDGVLQLSADMAESMNKIIAAAEPGDIVTMSIVQDGKEITLL